MSPGSVVAPFAALVMPVMRLPIPLIWRPPRVARIVVIIMAVPVAPIPPGAAPAVGSSSFAAAVVLLGDLLLDLDLVLLVLLPEEIAHLSLLPRRVRRVEDEAQSPVLPGTPHRAFHPGAGSGPGHARRQRGRGRRRGARRYWVPRLVGRLTLKAPVGEARGEALRVTNLVVELDLDV